jgi:hypothetical protein
MSVDFRDLNKASIKDNFPLPNMEFFYNKLLDRPSCPCWMVSMDIIRSWWLSQIEQRKHLSHHGRHMHMIGCPLV